MLKQDGISSFVIPGGEQHRLQAGRRARTPE
jgi:hypothetical protein